MINVQQFPSPVGVLLLGSSQGKLCLCDWLHRSLREKIDQRLQSYFKCEFVEKKSGVIRDTIEELNEYFNGNRKQFSIPMAFAGTAFQKSVWNELKKIPFGKTVTYQDLATSLGQPKAVRAVASANGANAISILIPCHRVIGANKALTGYAGGLPAKRKLLDLETPHLFSAV